MIALPQRALASVPPGTAHLERKRDYPEKRRTAARLPLGIATAGLVFAALLAGCAHVKPAPIAEERALPAAATPLWTNVAAAWPGDDRFGVLNSGHDAYEWRLRAIDSASSSLGLQTFLWKEDRAGSTILARILAAADRGVRVRILLDDSFTVGEGDTISALTRHPNIQFRIYNPFARRPDDLVLRQIANATDFDRVDHRMHNKVMITDTQAAIVGGRNLADEYFGLHPSANFRDLEVVALGLVVAELARVFDSYWQSQHHVTLGNLLGYLLAGEDPPQPDFTRPCPQLGPAGCQLPVACRPFNCIIFLCEAIDRELSVEQRQAFARIESELRQVYHAVAARCPGASLRGLLIAAARLRERPLLTNS